MAEPIKRFYIDGLCPDCLEEIPADAVEGDRCAVCGSEFSEEDAEAVREEAYDDFYDDCYYDEEDDWEDGDY